MTLILAVFLLLALSWWRATRDVNMNWREYFRQAEAQVKEHGAGTLGIRLDAAQSMVSSMGRRPAPFLVKPNPEYELSVFYFCDTFFSVYQGAILNLRGLKLELPKGGEEVYFRHISVLTYTPPHIEVILSRGNAIRQFRIGSEVGNAVVDVLRATLRGTAPQPVSSSTDILARRQEASPLLDSSNAATTEPRYCYIRLSKLKQLLDDPAVIDDLMEQLQIPGASAEHRKLTQQQKMEYIERHVDNAFRPMPASTWYGVPTWEVLAGSIWRTQYREGGRLTKKLIRRGLFCGVSEEDDLRVPVARWLRDQGYEPYMEVPLGLARVDVLGYKKASLLEAGRLVAVELKNDYEQFKRAMNQAGTFAEYANVVYLAMTPAFGAEYLDRNEQSVHHWDATVLERKVTQGGFGLLVVEREQVFEVIKPRERSPRGANFAKVVDNLRGVNLIEC